MANKKEFENVTSIVDALCQIDDSALDQYSKLQLYWALDCAINLGGQLAGSDTQYDYRKNFVCFWKKLRNIY